MLMNTMYRSMISLKQNLHFDIFIYQTSLVFVAVLGDNAVQCSAIWILLYCLVEGNLYFQEMPRVVGTVHCQFLYVAVLKHGGNCSTKHVPVVVFSFGMWFFTKGAFNYCSTFIWWRELLMRGGGIWGRLFMAWWTKWVSKWDKLLYVYLKGNSGTGLT